MPDSSRTLLAPLVGQWPALAQLPLVYIVLGVVWLAALAPLPDLDGNRALALIFTQWRE